MLSLHASTRLPTLHTALPLMRNANQTPVRVILLNLHPRLRMIPTRVLVVFRQLVRFITAQTLGHTVRKLRFNEFGFRGAILLVLGVRESRRFTGYFNTGQFALSGARVM